MNPRTGGHRRSATFVPSELKASWEHVATLINPSVTLSPSARIRRTVVFSPSQNLEPTVAAPRFGRGEGDEGLSSGQVIGIVIGVVAAAVVAVIGYFVMHGKASAAWVEAVEPDLDANGQTDPVRGDELLNDDEMEELDEADD